MRGQISIEFLGLLAIMFFMLALASFAALTSSNDVNQEREKIEARKIAALVAQEINMAVEIGDGYSHKFQLPELFLTGDNYSVDLSEERFVYVLWETKSYLLPVLADNITGNLKKGENTIKNVQGVITFE